MPAAVKVTGASPATVTSTVLGPGVRPRVRMVAARPWASVVAAVAERVPPPAVTAKVTATPAIGEPSWSSRETTRGAARGEPLDPCCSSPPTLSRVVGADRVRAEKVTASRSLTMASTVFRPGALPRVRVVAARPRASVSLVSTDRDPPPPMIRKRTRTPSRGSPFWSLTSMTKGSERTASGPPCCPSPDSPVTVRGWSRTRPRSQTRAVPSSDPEAKVDPSGAKASLPIVPPCPSRVAIKAPVATSRTSSTSTLPITRVPETTIDPSGEKAAV